MSLYLALLTQENHMKILSPVRPARRHSLVVGTLLAAALSSTLVIASPLSPAMASEPANVIVPVDCTVSGDILVRADPGDLLVFTRGDDDVTTCLAGDGAYTLYLDDYNAISGWTASGFLEGINVYSGSGDFTPTDTTVVGSWDFLDRNRSTGARLRAIGGFAVAENAWATEGSTLVGGSSILGVIETNGPVALELNRIIWEGPRTIPPVEAALEFPLGVGSQVAGTTVTFSGSGLLPGSAWSVEVHSTPTIIAYGIVGSDGTYSSTATMPASLEAGVHSIMVTTINADNTTTTNTIVLAIGVDGSLLYKSEPMVDTDESAITVAQEAAASAVASNTTVAAALAVTGFDGTLVFAVAGTALVLLLAGLGLILRRRRTSPRGR
jgi:hypothetical protein